MAKTIMSENLTQWRKTHRHCRGSYERPNQDHLRAGRVTVEVTAVCPHHHILEEFTEGFSTI